MPETFSRFTLLPGQTQYTLTRVCLEACGGITLQAWEEQGLRQVSLDQEQLQALLLVLPREALLMALGANPFFGLDDPATPLILDGTLFQPEADGPAPASPHLRVLPRPEEPPTLSADEAWQAAWQAEAQGIIDAFRGQQPRPQTPEEPA